MRFGTIFESNAAANYRALYPMRALARRGHDVVLPSTESGDLTEAEMLSCDAVLIYRRTTPETQRVIKQLQARGIGVVYDNDDDFRRSPNQDYKNQKHRDLHWSLSMNMARAANVVTTTTSALAERYEKSGARNVVAIDNYLAPGKLKRKARRHKMLVIGWIAGLEHAVDAAELHIPEALRAAQSRHPEVRVECIGVDLQLDERYRHIDIIHFDRLPDAMSRWDIAIAPLSKHPFNATRSAIKLKEYAASGLPWLASPRGPYADFGEDCGGRLVADTDWVTALDSLVSDAGARKRLAKAGRSWAKTQTTDVAASSWETVLMQAAERASTRAEARAVVPA